MTLSDVSTFAGKRCVAAMPAMAGQTEPARKSRLSRASTVYPDSAETLPRSSKGVFVKSSSAVCGIVACVAIALAVPHLYPHSASDDGTLESVPGHTNVTTEASACTAQRRDNATIEAALEAAVSGAFLADAASLGFQGWVLVPSVLDNFALDATPYSEPSSAWPSTSQ